MKILHLCFLIFLIIAGACSKSTVECFDSGVTKLDSADYNGAVKDFSKAIMKVNLLRTNNVVYNGEPEKKEITHTRIMSCSMIGPSSSSVVA